MSYARGRRKKKKKKEEDERRRRKKMNKIKKFKFGLFKLVKVSGTFGVDIKK